METKLFERLKESMTWFNIPEGGYIGSHPVPNGVNKSQAYSMEDQCRVMREIYDHPPMSKERYAHIAFYLETFCSSFCGVIYDPLGEDAPLVTSTDAEGDMRWFEALLDKMCNRTLEEVQADYSGTIMEMFFKSEVGKEIEALSKEVLETKVTD